jgi:putative ABC transport system permease protein
MRVRRAGEIMGSILQNLRLGVRGLLRQPSFTVTAVLTLALGIGTTTAMFSVVYSVVLQPLPFADPDRLVRLWTVWKPSLGRGAVSAANARDWRAQNHVFQDLAVIHNNRSFNFVDEGDAERLQGARVSASFFPVLGVSPLIGRAFTEDENEIGQDNVAVLSHTLWLRRFNADPSIVGRSVRLNGVAVTVVGVMRPDFRYPSRETQLWMPLTVPPEEYLQRNSGSYSTIARLKPGVTLEQAGADMRSVSSNLARQYPEYNRSTEAGLAPLLDEMVGGVRRPLFILLGAVGAMLLIGCANLTNLLLARGVARRRELAIRTALGASRGRLAEASITELVPLLVMGGALGLVTASGVVRAIVPLLPANFPRAEGIGIHLPVLAFSTAVVIVVALLVGVWPAVDAVRTTPSAGLADLSRGSTSAPGRTHLRDLLVVGQIATTLLLLVGATVLMRSFMAVREVDAGFDPDRVLSAHIAIPRSQYPLDAQVVDFYTRVLGRVQSLPGVIAVGMVHRLPLSGTNQTGGVQIDGASDAPWPSVETRTTSPDYFRALGIPIKEGRSFTASDGADAPMVAIVDERLASLAWPGTSPIGHRLREGAGMPWSTVVGVVGHVHHTALDDDSQPQVYWNYPQRPQERVALVVKARGDPTALTKSVTAAVREVDPQQALYDTRTMDAVVDRSLGHRRFQMLLLAVFAAIALALAGIGAYGVIAYGVSQRVREFGVRMALGARRRDVIGMVLRRGGLLFTAGALAGLVLATIGVSALSSLVYGIAPRDVPSFIVSTVVLFVVSMAACYVPARRAARVEPTVALRSE